MRFYKTTNPVTGKGYWTVNKEDAIPSGFCTKRIVGNVLEVRSLGTGEVIANAEYWNYTDKDNNPYASLAALEEATFDFFVKPAYVETDPIFSASPAGDPDLIGQKIATQAWVTSQLQYDNNGVLDLPNTTSPTTGVIKKNGVSFLHNFSHPTGETAIPDGRNLFLGEYSGNFTMGSTATSRGHSSYNVGLGFSTLHSLTTGYNNVAVGTDALPNVTEGLGNIGIGTLVGNLLSTGRYNVLIGVVSGYSMTTGVFNVLIGHSAGYSMTTGGDNVLIGSAAARFIADGTTSLTNVSCSIYLGDSTKASADGVINENVFGYDAIGKGSNTVNIGNTSITDTYLNGKVHSTSSVQVADDTTVASATNVGAIRYRTSGNNSYCDMVMQTGEATYAWVNIKQNTW